MNHLEQYRKLIEKRRNLTPEGYTENHHIFPECLGGLDSPDNMVRLLAKEHLIAHLLLAKIHGGPLISAAWMMSNMRKYGSRKYAWLKEAWAKMMSERDVTEVTKNKMSVSAKIRANSPEGKVNCSEAGKRHPSRIGWKKAYNPISGEEIFRPPEEILLLSGDWIIGKHRPQTHTVTEAVLAAMRKLGDERKGISRSLEIGQKISETKRLRGIVPSGAGTVWMNNGSVNRRVRSSNLEGLQGWTRGRI